MNTRAVRPEGIPIDSAQKHQAVEAGRLTHISPELLIIPDIPEFSIQATRPGPP